MLEISEVAQIKFYVLGASTSAGGDGSSNESKMIQERKEMSEGVDHK
jgi:hypothetical protein